MSNKIKVLALLPILSLFLTGCTLQERATGFLANLPVIGKYFGGGFPTEPVNLSVWGLWEDPEVIGALISSYQQLHPNVTINYEDRSIMEPIEYKERVFTRSSESSPGVDIVLVHNSWVPGLSVNLSTMATTVMTAEQYQQKFYPAAVQSALLNNQIYGTPAYYDGLVLVYNKRHFVEVGEVTPPVSWEEFRRKALNLTIRGGEDGTELTRAGAAMGAANNIDHFSDILGLMWAQADVAIPTEINTEPAYDALTYYTNYVLEDKVWDGTMPEATQAFIQEKVSMIFVPSWQIVNIVQAMPNIEDIGVAHVPQAYPDDPTSWASFWMFVVPTNSQNQTVAWDFLNFLAQDEQQLAYYNEALKVRAFGAPYASTTLADQVANPYIKPVLDIAPYSKTAEIAARAGNRRQVDALKEAVNNVLNGSMSAEAALETAKPMVEGAEGAAGE